MYTMHTILDFLNENVDGGDVLIWGLIILIAWCLIWRLFLGEWLFKHDVGTFWHDMYEIGPGGTLGLALVLLILIALFVTSIQAGLAFGGKLVLILCIFWGGLIFCFVKLIQYLKK